MEINKRLIKLKLDIVREPSFNAFATNKAKAIINEVLSVFKERINRMTNSLPTMEGKLNHGYGLALSNGKDKIFGQIDSIKNDILISRTIDNSTSQWAINKLNKIKRL